jgi:hypothetical protein
MIFEVRIKYNNGEFDSKEIVVDSKAEFVFNKMGDLDYLELMKLMLSSMDYSKRTVIKSQEKISNELTEILGKPITRKNVSRMLIKLHEEIGFISEVTQDIQTIHKYNIYHINTDFYFITEEDVDNRLELIKDELLELVKNSSIPTDRLPFVVEQVSYDFQFELDIEEQIDMDNETDVEKIFG